MPDEPNVPLTEEDASILAAMRAMWETADPVPPDLVTRVQFAVDLDDVDVEAARLVELTGLAAARSDEFARLVTFQSDSLTIMITVEPCADGTTRIDGWLTPAACHRIELHGPSGPMSTESDDVGRFALDAVPAGATRFIVHGDACRVITPAIEI
jgi:hypothetical protein